MSAWVVFYLMKQTTASRKSDATSEQEKCKGGGGGCFFPFLFEKMLACFLVLLLTLSFFLQDHGDSNDAALLQFRGAGQQPDVQPVWGGGHPGLLLCALAEREGGGPRRAGWRPGHLLLRLCLVPGFPLQPSRC